MISSVLAFCLSVTLKIRSYEGLTLPWELSQIVEISLFRKFQGTVEPRYNEVLGTMKITLLYQVSHYIRVKTQRNIKNWDQQNYLVIRGFCYIRPLCNEVPLYNNFQTKPFFCRGVVKKCPSVTWTFSHLSFQVSGRIAYLCD